MRGHECRCALLVQNQSPARCGRHRGCAIFNGAPVPEPETWAMLFAGLGLVGIAAHRRMRC
ncbi:MAG: PEPxxWA-CTERM sorting domain-containing protein [Thiobacillus sp.]|nr:PEPxxWA-CTERM sorting domain-containing protein [Thiobacillus sp.]